MGCVRSQHSTEDDGEYIETLTLRRQISKRNTGGPTQNLKISISVIADPMSSDDETAPSVMCNVHSVHKHSFNTVSHMEGRKYTKFPHMVGYKMCRACNKAREDVLNTVAPDGDEKEICRKCSVKKRKNSEKKKNLKNLNKESLNIASVSQSLATKTVEVSNKIDITHFASLLALTALDLTAPASEAILKNRKNTWIQLAGHPGGFAPAGPNTIWKKRYTKDNNEAEAYEALMEDPAHDVVPIFYREVEYNSEYFIEIEDLLQHFTDPNIMDIKMGTRTFLEAEVMNSTQRKDLYDKMVALDPDAPTAEEKRLQSITKLRYMQFREQESSTADYGFRIEAVRISGEPPTTNLKRVKTKEQIHDVLSRFVHNSQHIQGLLLERLRDIRDKLQESSFFMSHELIGSSVLVMYDQSGKCGIWVIDFSKTNPVPDAEPITHRLSWSLGNHEDGFLFGIDNLIQFFSDIEVKEEITANVCQSQAREEGVS
ncbi:inositol-trisphosphate 3-kinase homolog [Mya arenaria]|uniref:inositol-trisphosphate 3-kinase homolog n=1 Tax=Mya arenaria TaxID=6604 RepID=UPI0022E18FBA|nr:inositol-trisphosphate 3-kinase homolog [Mya arenaria]